MDINTTPFEGLLILKPQRFEDDRGFFTETYNLRRFDNAGVCSHFVQDNLSLSTSTGTLRGLHFQKEPFAQAKLVTVLKGAVRDVVVDLRRHSNNFGRHYSIEIREEDGIQLFVPVGFAHGFITLHPNTLFLYKVSNYYSPEYDTGIRFDDPTLGINWNYCGAFNISERDLTLPPFDPKNEYFP